MKGYKVFNPDWTCRGFQFEVGEIYEEDVIPSCCSRGFHFCTELKDCFNYYSFRPNNKVAEIEALGEIDAKADGSKHCTNKIKIVREISWEEVLKMVNMGKANTGLCNSGSYNIGRYNSGSYNSGRYNSGRYNSGDRNNGDRNSGDWNITNFSSGCFNTKEAKILMFNKPCDWTLQDWRNSHAKSILNNIPNNAPIWVQSENMTDEEKEKHPEYETTGGYLKEIDNSKCVQAWWNNLSDYEKNVIKSLPNFDAKIFKDCTGIVVEGEDDE